MTLKLTRKQIYTYKGRPTDALYYVCKDLDTRISALDGAGEIEQSMIENADTAGNILVANSSKVFADVAMSGDVTIATTGATTIGAKKVTAAKTAIAEGKIFVGGADGAAAEQTMSGDVAISSTAEATIQPDSVDTGKLKVVTRDVTIAAEAASGNVTNAADINGVILGHYPKTSVDSAIESIALTAESGQITVTLNANQAAETPATVSVVVLQAPAT
jgi:hypothetical protein